MNTVESKSVVKTFNQEFAVLKASASTLATFEPWERLFVDRGFNIRDDDETNYDPEAVKELRANLNAFGQQVAMILSLQTDAQDIESRGGADLLVCRGNLRYYSMMLDRQEDQLLIDAEKLDPMDRRWQYVKCEVRTGLTREQEEVLMLDHDQEKELSAYEMYKAVKRLTDRGFNETEVKNTLGFNRGEITNHFKATQLPKDVQDKYVAYLKRKKGEQVFKMDGTAIRQLYTAFTQVKDENGKKIKTQKTEKGGPPAYKEKLKELLVTNAPGSGAKVESTETRVKKIQKWASDPARTHPMMVSLIDYLLKVDEGKVNLSHLYDNIVRSLHETFPQAEEMEEEAIVQYEEGVSKDLGTVPTGEDTESWKKDDYTESLAKHMAKDEVYEGTIEPTETENTETENTETENTETENTETENTETVSNEQAVEEEMVIDNKGRPRRVRAR